MDDKQKEAVALALKTLAMIVNGNFPELAEELKAGAKEFIVTEIPETPETPEKQTTETPKA